MVHEKSPDDADVQELVSRGLPAYGDATVKGARVGRSLRRFRILIRKLTLK